MIRNQLFQEYFNEFFKKRTLDEHQIEHINTSLSNSRYAQLSYHSNPDFYLKQIQSATSSQNTDSDSDIATKKPTEEEVEVNVENISGDVDDDEIDELIESFTKTSTKPQQQPLSPENHFLSLQQLSPEEEIYINEQDQLKQKQFQDATRKIARNLAEKQSNNQALSSLSALKEQQKALRDENSEYVVKRAQNRPRKVRIEEAESKLAEITKQLKQIKQKFESTSALKSTTTGNLTDSDLYRELIDSIAGIESLVLKRMDTAHLAEIERTYTTKGADLGRRIEAEIEKRERERALELMRARQLLEQKFAQKVGRLVESVEHLKTAGTQLGSDVRGKLESARALNLAPLVSELSALGNSIQGNVDRVVAVRDRLRSTNVVGLSDVELDRVMDEAYSTFVQCSARQEEFVTKFKTNEVKIQTHLDGLLKAQKEKEIEEQKQKAAVAAAAAAAEAEKQRKAEEDRKSQEEKRKQEEKEQQEKKEKEAAAAAAAQKENKKASSNEVLKQVDETNKTGANSATLAEHEKNQLTLARLRYETDQALSVPTLKMYKFDLQKAINFPLNSLLDDKTSDENKRNFSEKIKTLCRLLSGQTCTITSTLTVNPSKHPQAIDFCLVYLARKMVEKSEDTVASRPESAFQYAQLILDVLRQVKYFEVILIAHFNEKCPFTVPYYKNRAPNQTDEKYFESLGYKIIDGKIEDEVHFYKRMSGILTLYFTLMILTPVDKQHELQYFNVRRAWRWLVEVLNMTPRPNSTAEMLNIFFKCCGHTLHSLYGKQFLKLVNMCMNEYFALIRSIPSEKQSEASVGRLKTTLDDFNKSRRFPVWKKQ